VNKKLTVSQAAERAGVCATIIYGWCAARLFPFYRIGSKGTRGKIFIDESDLASYLESCRIEPASVPVPKAVRPPKVARPVLKHLTLRPS
jgi:hypothetical protein